MTTEQAGVVVVGAVALVALLCAALAWRVARRALARVEDLSGRLADRDAGEEPAPSTPTEALPYVITGLETDEARPAAAGVPARIDGRLFTDLVARETAVRAAAWSHGVRRALSPESRNRIRFQVRQHAKQTRRERRAEVKEALREYRARQRATGPAEGPMTVRADDGDAA